MDAAGATNMALPALYALICGRGAQEKTLAELKGEFALDVVPTRHYGANADPALLTHHPRRSRISGRHVLRLSHNPATEALYASLNHCLAA